MATLTSVCHQDRLRMFHSFLLIILPKSLIIPINLSQKFWLYYIAQTYVLAQWFWAHGWIRLNQQVLIPYYSQFAI